MLATIKKRKPAGVQIGLPLDVQAISTLADMLDPPIFRPTSDWEAPQDVVDWAHYNFIDPVTNRLVQLQPHQQRLLRVIFKLIWAKAVTTVVWSEIKKSGKTTTAGLVGAYWSSNVEMPNEIVSVANDQEQAQGRIYAAMVPTLRRLGWDVPEMKPSMINRQSGSVVKAIGTNYAGEAGGNPGLTLWSELWAYTSEGKQRLWEELTPVPTRMFSVRWVETYAGFKGESDLLWKLYCQAFAGGDEEKPLGIRVQGLEDLPVWYLQNQKTLVYWSHDPRMPWQTQEYYDEQRSSLRPNAFVRLHTNHWVQPEDIFVDLSVWDSLERCRELGETDTRPLVLGADASTSSDSTSLVASTWSEKDGCAQIVAAWVWKPAPLEGIANPSVDLDNTIGAQIVSLIEGYNVLAVYADPYQLHSILTRLQQKYDKTGKRKLIVPFSQQGGRIKADGYFYSSITTKKLHHIDSPILREHIMNAVARETEEGIRIDKAKSSRKIDAAVAASMSVFGCSERRPSKKTFLKV